MRRDSWDPSQQIQGLKCPSQPNPNKNNIETCSVKLPRFILKDVYLLYINHDRDMFKDIS